MFNEIPHSGRSLAQPRGRVTLMGISIYPWAATFRNDDLGTSGDGPSPEENPPPLGKIAHEKRESLQKLF